MLTSSIVTEIIRIEEKKNITESDRERIKELYALGAKIDNEKIRKLRRTK